jgi:hypothetical protein
LLLALLACAADPVSLCRPVSGTYKISDDTSGSYADVANGTAVIEGDFVTFEYTDAKGTAWKVTYVIGDYSHRGCPGPGDSASK